MTKGIRELVRFIKSEIQRSFDRRVISFVLFGTSRTNKVFNDIDLELLLNEPSFEDFTQLNSIFSKVHEKFPYKIDFHLSYKSQLVKLGYFRRKAQGSYLLWSLAKGELLLGNENSFKKILKQTPIEIKFKDLFIKNQEYQYSLREFLFENNFLEKRHQFNKYLMRYLYQLAIISEKITYDDVLDVSRKKLLNQLLNSNIFSLEANKSIKLLNGAKSITLEKLLEISSVILHETDNLMAVHYKKIYG